MIQTIRQFPQPLDWTALEAWARMTRRTFSRWELDVLAHIDARR